MDFYKAAIEILLQDKTTQNWAELESSIKRAILGKPVAWDFPLKACLAVGAKPEKSLPAIAAITCAHMAIILVDDLLDEDPRGEYHRVGFGRAANLAVGLNALGVRILLAAKSAAKPEDAVSALNEMIQTTAYGQDLDVGNLHTEDGYWKVTRAKSSPYFAAALYLGGLYGGANPVTLEQFREFGFLFGEIMQIHDDLNDCLATPANVDWLQGRSPLPLLFAELVDHPDRVRFKELRGRVVDADALQEAQSILVTCGAISYCVNELIARKDRAEKLLHSIELVDRQHIQQLLDQAMAPVKHLFASVGAEFQN